MSSHKVCFVDLDGVLVDFVEGAYRFYKQELDRTEVPYDFWRTFGLTEGDFWGPLGEEFWSELLPTSEWSKILSKVEEVFGDHVFLCTSPCLTQGSSIGKARWVDRHLPRYNRRLLLCAHKHLLAAPRRLLVDDNDKNCKDWQESGGQSIIVPRSWNSKRTYEECMMEYLSPLLEGWR